MIILIRNQDEDPIGIGEPLAAWPRQRTHRHPIHRRCARRARALRRLRLAIAALSLLLAGLAAATAVYWRQSLQLERDLADSRWQMRVLRDTSEPTEAGQLAGLSTRFAQSAAMQRLIPDTLIPLRRYGLRAAIFTLSAAGDGPRVICHLRPSNPETGLGAGVVRISLYDQGGTLIGSADYTGPREPTDEAGSDTFEIPTRGKAAPRWFAIRSLGPANPERQGDRPQIAESPSPQDRPLLALHAAP